ncbi:winged helix-turn-helix domain-containing protein [Methanolobus sp. WCC4]|uniref:helix-turn-helix transcriptional regulator n=1 Tax=Methanolobus sp. WCC4 TaxID=3125784 RepID=UPI0030F9BD55
MRRSLIDVVFMSEKRKNLLLLLRNGPRKMEEILETLDVTRHAMLPQIKILSEHGLVIKSKDICRLTEMGEIIVDDMSPLVGTIATLEGNHQYWMEHDLSPIPLHLLRRIRELHSCHVLEPDLNDMFELNRELVEQALNSGSIMGATSFLHPAFPSFLLDLVKNGIDVSIVMSEPALEKHIQDYKDELEVFLKSKKGKLFVYPGNLDLASLFITDEFLMMCLFDRSGNYDRKDLVFCNEDALNWGRELFEYYLLRSKPITDL